MTEENHAIRNAAAWAANIVAIIALRDFVAEHEGDTMEDLDTAQHDEFQTLCGAVDDEFEYQADETLDRLREKIEERIQEMPLSVEVRDGWRVPGSEAGGAEEFAILLSTGGPALRLVGELDGGQPKDARLEWQDWGTPWTEYREARENYEALDAFAACFYFGD